MARVDFLREVQDDFGKPGGWTLCFQWCRYRMDEGSIQYGYRFIWRRENEGSLQAARGQARLPNVDIMNGLVMKARAAGWADRDGFEMETIYGRLVGSGYQVDLASGFVGFHSRDASVQNKPTAQDYADAKLLQEWCR